MAGQASPIYKFDHNVLGQDDVELSAQRVQFAGGAIEISLELDNPYDDMC